jgi:TetR/AcrR family transcriptional regulator, transcriptional repressor for nem operon
MARPKEFDCDRALKKAMDVFWQQGYKATSTDDLVRAMSIGRQSMYDTFGDKHRLYLEALRLYETGTGAELFRRIYETPSPFVAICDYILSIADGTSADRARGCFYVNATNELAPSDPDVAAVIRTSSARCEAAFERILREAKQRGEVDRSVDERVAARFLLSTIRGLRVSAKAGVESKDLRAIATLALSGLKPR